MTAIDPTAPPQPAPAAGPLLTVADLAVRRGAARAVDEVGLAVAESEIVAVLGANGAGKSTLLRAVMGLDRIERGTIVLDGLPLGRMAPETRAALGLGYAPEGRRVFPGLTVRDNLAAVCRAGRRQREERIDGVFQLFPQLKDKDRALAWQLSGGQQQMLSIGRALMNAPKVLLLDEPSLGLAPALIAELMERLTWVARYGTAILLAEQNVGVALSVADRAMVLRLGRMVLSGPAASLAADPAALEDAMLAG